MASEQDLKHGVPQVVPDIVNQDGTAFWGDVATILPWRLYQTYGNLAQLREHYPIMTRMD
uniref:Bac_rhamnosid n=1 Tax=uncultured Clavibacter sp. TaxID=378178 RepID=A0A060CH54_9MICO|nr:Bac_rhamnosid [uncultured Clavibacter sp.]